MVDPNRILTPHKRKVLRKRFTRAETLFGAVFLLAVAAATGWILAQRDNFDPADRDISFETLREDSVDAHLYTPPLKRWVEPGSETATAGLPDVGPFPAGILADGWSLDGRVESFDASNLYEKIDGAADQYLSFGFVRLDYASVAKAGEFVNMEVYDQGEFRNALGIFAAQRAPGRKVESDGEVYYYTTSAGLIGTYRNLYFKIAGSASSPAVLAKARQILAEVPGLPASPTAAPRPFLILTRKLGVPFDGLEYQKSDVFAYAFLSDVWFGAVGGEKDSRFFIHEADSPEKASGLYSQLEDEQKNEYATVEEGEDTVLLEHKFLKTFFAMRRSGSFLLGVDGASTSEAARNALGRLGKAVTLEGRQEADPKA